MIFLALFHLFLGEVIWDWVVIYNLISTAKRFTWLCSIVRLILLNSAEVRCPRCP